MNRLLILVLMFGLIGISFSSKNNYPKGLYVKDTGEFVCFNKDSVSFKVKNDGGLTTFQIGLGKAKFKNRKVKLNLESMQNFVSTIAIEKSSGFSKLKISYSNDNPVISATVTLKNFDTNIESFYLTDEKGFVDITEKDLKKLIGNKIEISAYSLGLASFKQAFFLEDGFNYNFKSLYPDGYSLNYNKYYFKIISLTENEIIFDTPLNKRVKMFKSNDDCFCKDSFFLVGSK